MKPTAPIAAALPIAPLLLPPVGEGLPLEEVEAPLGDEEVEWGTVVVPVPLLTTADEPEVLTVLTGVDGPVEAPDVELPAGGTETEEPLEAPMQLVVEPASMVTGADWAVAPVLSRTLTPMLVPAVMLVGQLKEVWVMPGYT